MPPLLQEFGEEGHYIGLEEGRGEGPYELEYASPVTEESCIPLSPISGSQSYLHWIMVLILAGDSVIGAHVN